MAYTINNPSYTYGNLTVPTNSVTVPYTMGTGITIPSDATWSTTATLGQTNAGKIKLEGENADIEINGQSLNETLQAIKHQLLIPTVVNRDPKLEREFEELQALGQEYQKKLEYYREQMKIFETLKKQD